MALSLSSLPQGMNITARSSPASRRSSRPRRSPSSPSCTAPSSRAARSCWPRASSAPQRLDAGERPDFLADHGAHPRRRLEDRAGAAGAGMPPRRDHRPGRRKMVINAFNSGADCYMTDFEDATRRTGTTRSRARSIWRRDPPHAHRWSRTARATSSTTSIATLQVRPRGWHLDEKHVLVDGQRVSGGIFDFAPVHVPQREGTARARRRPVLLPAQDGEPSRGAPVERHLRGERRTSSACRKARSRRPC